MYHSDKMRKQSF